MAGKLWAWFLHNTDIMLRKAREHRPVFSSHLGTHGLGSEWHERHEMSSCYSVWHADIRLAYFWNFAFPICSLRLTEGN